MAEPLFYKTASELSRLLSERQLSSVELTQAVIERTQSVDGKVYSFLHQNTEDALAQAKASDKRREHDATLGPLDGIPVSLKDIIAVKGQPLTCASKMLEKFVSPYDATAVMKLKQAGAVLWGRLNMDEFAMGSSTENSAFHPTSNPWDLKRVPGGSSGGSAAAVAAGETILSLGSDTGGSIRQPAAFCGVVGLKPTYGRVSRYGLVAFASSLDQIGPLSRCVADAALVLQVIAGWDVRDATSDPSDVPNYTEALNKTCRPGKLGVPREYFGKGLDTEVRAAVEQALKNYRDAGWKIIELSLPHTELAVPVYYLIATAEASSNLARYDGVRYTHRSPEPKDAIELYFKSRGQGFGDEVKRRIILGTYVLSSGYYDAYYLRAQRVRTLIRNDFLKAFETVDAIVAPTTPTTAFSHGERSTDPLAMYLSDIYTISANLSGLPAVSLPCGLSREGLPIGLQLIGKPFDETNLLATAHVFESHCPDCIGTTRQYLKLS